ncbi:hypothetical protein [Variovorax ginsengisoli]|uniref:Zinc ribbon domain-containing protein n=1 Tax=Variovorax ginsengisoli TaxID=363844 RepID=A0ABT8S1R7_9BURK|nr:hypothetical protein [Variovorax ginsengisoli]MDN8613704.1 hypothetical protein [Variovorax ginsengisoli]MDO1532874.1 hypothetical protein [Variovorax ginsengisoli]
MSVVCNVCGSANRSKAKYCVGCAHPLPGFTPTGPAALDAVMAIRPAAGAAPRGAEGGRHGSAVPVLPAETAAFWLKAGCVGLAMVVGFAAWCFHVTRKPGAPPLQEQILTLVVPESAAPRAPSAVPVPSASSAPPAATRDARLDALGIARVGPAAESVATPDRTAVPQAARLDPPPAMTPRPAARPKTAVASSRRSPIEAPPPSAVDRAPLRVDPDPGPPIAPGPGPLYDRGATPSQRFADTGPPVVPGPGPLYNFARPAVRAPSSPIGNDLGPPIAAGPGPQFDYSTRGAR